jgi:hypothetical protein
MFRGSELIGIHWSTSFHAYLFLYSSLNGVSNTDYAVQTFHRMIGRLVNITEHIDHSGKVSDLYSGGLGLKHIRDADHLD